LSRTAELHLSERWLSGSAWSVGSICREFHKIKLPWNYLLSDQLYDIVLWLLQLQIRCGRKV